MLCQTQTLRVGAVGIFKISLLTMIKLSLLQKVGKFSLLVNFVRIFQISKVREKRGFRSSSLLSTPPNQRSKLQTKFAPPGHCHQWDD